MNEAADKYFVGNAQLLRRLEMVERSLQHNAKVVVPAGAELDQRDRRAGRRDAGGAAAQPAAKPAEAPPQPRPGQRR